MEAERLFYVSFCRWEERVVQRQDVPAITVRDARQFQLYVALFLMDLMSEHGQCFNSNERPSTAIFRT